MSDLKVVFTGRTKQTETKEGKPVTLFCYATQGWSDEEKEALITSKKSEGVDLPVDENGNIIVFTQRPEGKVMNMYRANTGRFGFDRSENELDEAILAGLVAKHGAEAGLAIFKLRKGA